MPFQPTGSADTVKNQLFRAAAEPMCSPVIDTIIIMSKRKAVDTLGNQSKKPKRQTYRSEYAIDKPFITSSKIDIYHAFCTACNSDFSVKHAGLFDVNRHCERNKHKTNRRLQVERENTSRVTSMFGHSSSHRHPDREAEVTKAEFLSAKWLNLLLVGERRPQP